MEGRAEAVVVSGCFVAVTTFLLYMCIILRKRKAGALALVSPSAVFLVGVLARFALGNLMVSLTPRSLVLEGEYRQYLVTWTYSGEVAYLWLVNTIVVAFSFACCEWIKRRGEGGTRCTDDVVREGWFKWIKEVRSGGGYGRKVHKMATLGCLGIFFVGSCMSAVTGSMDRGSSYEYYASLAFRPEAAFIAFTRLKQVGYFLLPISWKESSRQLRVVLCICAISPLILESLAGGRGAVLYPVVMMFMGYMCMSIKQIKVLISGALLLIFLGFAVPYMAAYRDSPAMMRSHNDVIGRFTSLVQGVEKEKVGYRYMALGREIYACSDGFVLETAESKEERVENDGLGDINLRTIAKILLPRWISGNKSFEKGDGANIAKRLMGVTNDAWFPCITTPADLFRRAGWNGVVVGGGIMGLVIWCLDALWIAAGDRKKSLESLLLTVLPVSYVQSGLYGTVREVLWQLLWDLPKYIVAILVLGRIAEWARAAYMKRER